MPPLPVDSVTFDMIPAATALTGSEIIPSLQAGNDAYLTPNQINTFVGANIKLQSPAQLPTKNILSIPGGNTTLTYPLPDRINCILTSNANITFPAFDATKLQIGQLIEVVNATSYIVSLYDSHGVVIGVNINAGEIALFRVSGIAPDTLDEVKTVVSSFYNNEVTSLQSQITTNTNSISTLQTGKMDKSGGIFTGNVFLNGDATQALQPVTYQQFQGVIAGFSPKPACRLFSATNLVGTYNNGTGGVNSTFTLTATGVLTIDTKAVALNDRVCFNGQTDQTQNGLWVCTTAGAVGVQAVFTRAPDYDNSPVGEVVSGTYTNITDGSTTYKGTFWYMTTTGTITIGTSNIVFSQSNLPILGNGLTLSAPNTIAIADQLASAFSSNDASKTFNLSANKQGQLTAISILSIAIASSQITDKAAASGVASLDSGARLPAAQFPALSGDVTTSAGSLVTTINQSKLFAIYNTLNIAGNIDLTNATNFPVCPTFISTSFSFAGSKIIFPATNASNAPKVGKPILVENLGSITCDLVAQDGTTVIYAGLTAGSSVELVLTDTISANGGWGSLFLGTLAAGIFTVSCGGTGKNSLTSNGLLYGNGASAVGVTAAGTTGQILVGTTSAAPSFSNSILARSSSTAIDITSGGIVTKPLQPAFSIYLSTTKTNVTGDGTNYIVPFDTRKFDIGSNCNITTGIFTAPVTGKYRFDFSVFLNSIGIASATGIVISIITTAGTYEVFATSVNIHDANNNAICPGSKLVDMTAGDTAKIAAKVYGGSLAVGVGSTLYDTVFSGNLEC